jgi:hypothetical protein
VAGIGQALADHQACLTLGRPAASLKHQYRLQPELAARADRLPRRVQLDIQPDDDSIGSLGHCPSEAEFQIAELVAAERNAPVRSSRLMKMHGPPRARERFGAYSSGVGVSARRIRGTLAIRS